MKQKLIECINNIIRQDIEWQKERGDTLKPIEMTEFMFSTNDNNVFGQCDDTLFGLDDEAELNSWLSEFEEAEPTCLEKEIFSIEDDHIVTFDIFIRWTGTEFEWKYGSWNDCY